MNNRGGLIVEKNDKKKRYRGASAGILLTGLMSWFLMVFSEFGDLAFRFSLISLFVGITIFMYEMTHFIVDSLAKE
jgi:hypothetical protein